MKLANLINLTRTNSMITDEDSQKLHIELDKLEEKVRWLDALESAGLDNWGGCGDAYDILEQWDKEG